MSDSALDSALEEVVLEVVVFGAEVLDALVRPDEAEVAEAELEVGLSAALVLVDAELEGAELTVGELATARPWSGVLPQAAIKTPIATTPAERTNRIPTPIE